MTTSATDLSRAALAVSSAPCRRRALAAGAALTLVALLGACSSSGDESAGSTADASTSQEAPAAADLDEALSAYGEAEASEGGATARRSTVADSAAPVAGDDSGAERAVIRTGNVALRSDDVPTARFDVGKVLDAHGGEVSEESTQADDDGAAERVRLVLRVPVTEFEATMDDLEQVADLIDVSTNSQDVTTEVIDNGVRVELQRRSIDRISILLDEASDLRDVVSIERELSQREADLGSLEKRQAYLADQTAMATITLSIEPPRTQDETVVDDDEDGFLAGLSGGWDALQDVTTGLLTVGGAVLPFALVLLLIGVPARLAAKRVVRRRPAAPSPGTAPTATA